MEADAEKQQEKPPVRVDVRREAWNATLMAALASIGESPRLYQEDVLRGVLEHHAFYVNGVHAYTMLLRVDSNRDGSRDLVLIHGVAAAGSKGCNVTETVWPYLFALAKSAGIERVRSHTSRPGMEKVLEAAGFRLMEKVFTFEVGEHGQQV